MNKKKTLVLTLVAAVLAGGLAYADGGGWSDPENWALADQEEQQIIDDSIGDQEVRISNTGPGKVEVVVENPNGSPQKVTILSGNSTTVSVDEGGDVTLKDVNDEQGSAGTWKTRAP